ncbi:hypothetical protein GJ744_009134 [Endocarpon pusillum]|uniref:Uncharacterized protein n=1 Tax=Endocarpon pusillum TaxID=364733 RepID=A0A8H7E4T1_9EURO|nr:hypothetical protein GJ744_009134 [Endocarpon pusillum]
MNLVDAAALVLICLAFQTLDAVRVINMFLGSEYKGLYQFSFSRGDALDWYEEEDKKYGKNGKTFGHTSLDGDAHQFQR